ncbi:hypothetical protein EDB92DRAFT_1818189 [Lactarius akahatsu]|uniref:Uncharacterized protein n=1 Tax=Lactarius akahatsu TaxID=416441 RepID=A0AAD4QB24_9AGAM|nr:hypothetical protein EDB92DRAFT_1818189 [Lactarius akahatsu]
MFSLENMEVTAVMLISAFACRLASRPPAFGATVPAGNERRAGTRKEASPPAPSYFVCDTRRRLENVSTPPNRPSTLRATHVLGTDGACAPRSAAARRGGHRRGRRCMEPPQSPGKKMHVRSAPSGHTEGRNHSEESLIPAYAELSPRLSTMRKVNGPFVRGERKIKWCQMNMQRRSRNAMRAQGRCVTAGFVEAAIDAERSLYFYEMVFKLGIGPGFGIDFASSAGLLVVGLRERLM